MNEEPVANTAKTAKHAGDATTQADSNAANSGNRGAGVTVPPPGIFLLCLFVGIGLHYMLPLGLGIPEPLNWFGLVLVVAAITMLTMCWFAFRRAKTAIEPWRPTTSLVYSGCYGFSRNPIYLSMCICLFGIGISANSLWLLLSGLPCALVIYLLVIRKEEAYLQRQFGEQYQQYKQRVRRWI